MRPADLDPTKLDVPNLAPKPVLLGRDGKVQESPLDRVKRLLGTLTREQEILEYEAAENRTMRRRAVRLRKLDTTIAAMRAPGKARALRRRRAKNAVAKQSRKANR